MENLHNLSIILNYCLCMLLRLLRLLRLLNIKLLAKINNKQLTLQEFEIYCLLGDNSVLFPLAYQFQVAFKLTEGEEIAKIMFLLLMVLSLPICDKELSVGVKRSSIMPHPWFLQINLCGTATTCLFFFLNIFYYNPTVPNTTIKNIY